MPQPLISGTPPILRFGNQALPNGQGTMTYLNLNDQTSWWWRDLHIDHDYLQHGLAQVAYAGKGAYLSFDAKSRVLKLPMQYQEVTNPFGAALAVLSQSGEQMLTTDNATGILARFNAVRFRQALVSYSPRVWDFTLEFLCKTPWWQDLAATTFAAVPVSGSVSPGTSTGFTITYAGSVFCEPVFTLTIPAGNGVVINSLVLTNTVSAEALTIVFPGGLLASTAYSIVIDSSALTVKSGATQFDFAGSFPKMYPSAQVVTSQPNTFTAVIVTATGTTTSVTLGATYTPRWEI